MFFLLTLSFNYYVNSLHSIIINVSRANSLSAFVLLTFEPCNYSIREQRANVILLDDHKRFRNAMLQAVCGQFTDARSSFMEREREISDKGRSILIPKRIQRTKRIRAQRSFRVWNNNYARQLSRNSSAGEIFWKDATRDTRKRFYERAALHSGCLHSALKVQFLALTLNVIFYLFVKRNRI